MKLWLAMLLFFLGFTLVACSISNNGMDGDGPPNAEIKVGVHSFETTLGSYCWEGDGSGKCVDKVGPKELLKGKTPIKVKPGEKITLTVKYEPKPNEFHVLQISKNGQKEIKVDNNNFTAPMKKGTFYYSYGVWWIDDKIDHVSHGSASYAFVIKVE